MILKQWWNRMASKAETGAAFAEYALLATGIAMVVVVASNAFGLRLVDMYNGFMP
ncbi:Flp family type IVb pilin [Aeromicrobium terrae]|uniref:Flp family type IVb pilin n=1 Tax=Aeromicrobium terrae TaxID=2498846 RepID=UPI00164F3599|nr:hypothetical protein [Aeromicrobium terrae]